MRLNANVRPSKDRNPSNGVHCCACGLALGDESGESGECCIAAIWAWTRGVLLLLLGSRHVVLAEICWSLAARTLDCAQLVPGVRAGAACAGRVGRGVRSSGDTGPPRRSPPHAIEAPRKRAIAR